MDFITITNPSDNGTVVRPFVASGTYNTSNPSPQIVVVLKDSSGNVVATANPVMAMSGNWSGSFNPSQTYTGASIEATLGTATNTVTNITVT